MARLSRRNLLLLAGGTAVVGAAGLVAARRWPPRPWHEATFIGKAETYEVDLRDVISRGLAALGVTRAEVAGKRVLLKPNLVEVAPKTLHVVTHPAVVGGVIEVFLSLGAREVVVGEGPGHVRDTRLLLEANGLAERLREDRIPFVDLNSDDVVTVPNTLAVSKLTALRLPVTVREADIVVSLAKLKTHHWAGVTLSMKNLYGVMPGTYYGWPKNVLHRAGLLSCILDINAAVKPDLAIIDGIVGMEGDGPIMGTAKHVGVLVMGRNPTAVDATGARIMGIDPARVLYLAAASEVLGPIREDWIAQRGESIDSVRASFHLVDAIPALRALRGA